MLTVLATVTALMVVSIGGASAGSLAKPEDPVILDVTGQIAQTNEAGHALFDRAMLEKMGMETVKTTTDWTDGVTVFEGIRFDKLLESLGATGTTLAMTALNDYQVELDLDEIRRIPVILAMSMNGKPLNIRDKGPLWVVYPRDEYPEVASGAHNWKWIWQLKAVDVR